MFDSPQAVLDYLTENKDLLDTLEHRPRWELGLGVAMICGLIVYFRERANERLGESAIIASLPKSE